MTVEEFCCTCATHLSSIPVTYDEKTEKPAHYERQLSCCSRVICARCITDNPRFETYCPFCQVSSAPGPLPQGLKDPPAYSPPIRPLSHGVNDDRSEPPTYTETLDGSALPPEKSEQPAEDVLHFVHPDDSVTALSLKYGVPVDVMRRKNGLYTDHLLAARRTVLIPGEFYKGGVSLSPRPIEGEEEELRKSKVRRFMVACKVIEYDVALLYLNQAGYDLDAAIQAYRDDEKWEKEHPLDSKGKGNENNQNHARKYGVSGGLSRQI